MGDEFEEHRIAILSNGPGNYSTKRLVEEAKLGQLKIDCEKKGLDYNAEVEKYKAAKAEKDKAAAEKKADNISKNKVTMSCIILSVSN